MALDKVITQWELDTKDAQQETKKVEKNFKKAEEQGKKSASSITSSFKGVGLALAGAFAVDQIISFTRELAQTAIQLDALDKKAKIVFGESLPFVRAEAEKLATQMGLTNSQFIVAATSAGDLLVPMGFTRQAAAEMSTQLVGLSGALSEWTGGQVEATEVSDILTKALLGEREQLKTLGVSIMEVDVQNRLAEEGLKGLTGQALEQAKAQATLALIMEKTVDAQTSFAENSDSLVRQQAVLSATFENIKETLARGLTPAINSVMGVILDLIENSQPVVDVYDELFTLLGEMVDEFSALFVELGLVSEETNAAGGFMEFLAFTLRAAQTPIRIIIKGFTMLVQWLRSIKDTIKPVVDTIKEFASSLLDTLAPALEFLGFKAKEVEKGNMDLKESNEELTESVEDETSALEMNQQALKKNVEVKKKAKTATQELNSQIGKLKKQLEDQALAGNINNETLDKYLALTKKAESAQRRLKEAIKAVTEGEEIQGVTFEQVAEKAVTELTKVPEAVLPEVATLVEPEQTLLGKLLGSEDAAEQLRQQFTQNIDEIAINGADIALGLAQQVSDVRLGILENELAEGLISEQEFEKKSKEIKRKALVADKAAAIFRATIEGIRGVIAAAPNIPLQVALGVFNAAQIALIAAKPIPKFRHGKVNIQGPGTEISDSIPAMISKGETVTSADKTKKYMGELEAIHEGNFDDYITKTRVMPMMEKLMQKKQYNDDIRLAEMFDDTKMVKGISKLEKSGRHNTDRLIRELSQYNYFMNE